jgi:hypothetical protein
MQIFQQSSDLSKSVYGFDLVDDGGFQSIGISLGSPRDFHRANLDLISKKEFGFGEILPSEVDFSLMPSIAGVTNIGYLGNIFWKEQMPKKSLPIPKEDLPCFGGLVFIQPRNLAYQEAKVEIVAYIEKVGGRRVYISELAEELQIDMDLIEHILNDIRHSSGVGDHV